ncbi:MAG: M3 family metallopeptidase [Prevotellaceae bacterium]|jgi:peptidyl-dipeptidase Dcp|nr:M3 family metallopeptidase [Prevotellaceae bacterium]
MKKIIHIFTITLFIMTSCNSNKTKNIENNPFLTEWNTPYSVPPFDKIKIGHYMPAFEEGMRLHAAEIDSIANNRAEPTFENTIVAMDFSGELLRKVSSVFFNLESADTNDEMQQISEEISPKLTEHNDNIYLNEKLFARVKALNDKKLELNLNSEQIRLLEKYYRGFVRSGAKLNDAKKAELRTLNKELALAELKFGKNVLASIKSYKKLVENEAELEGLPQSVKQAAAEAAAAEGQKGKWLFTTDKASFLPVLQYANNRELRKELLTAYSTLANHNDSSDNKAVVSAIMKLRVKKAQLLGFRSPAAFILDDKMAKTPEAVFDFMKTVWQPAVNQAKTESAELQALMDKEGKGEKLEAYDWAYYAEKLRKQKYDLDEEKIREYFKMENVRQGAFDLATKLYGITFKKVINVPLYNKDAETFEVNDADGTLLGLLYTDYFPRAGKRAGAWMNNVCDQYVKDGKDHRPVIVNIGNLTKGKAGEPSLLTIDDVETVFHEFGHALHGLLSKCTYISTSGTAVTRDFVELPSQVMENWCFEPEVLKTYAKHYKTDEVIPQEFIDKLAATQQFNQGFSMTELLAAAWLDMDFHARTDTTDFDVEKFENQALITIGLIPEIIVRYRSTYFSHIFDGDGYAAGYYSYVWAEVLDADAFAAFKESGDIFNKEIATSFRKNILERGDSDDPMTLYKNFRHAEPNAQALLKRRGFIK